MKRPPLRPVSTWIVGAVMAVILLIAAFSGMGSVLIWLGLFALGTGIYVFAFRRGSWARLPRSRAVGGVALGVGALVLIVGAAIYPTHRDPAPTAANGNAASFTLRNWNGSSASKAVDSLRNAPADLHVVTSDGESAPADLEGWVVVSESPAPGSLVRSGQSITVTVRPADGESASSSAPAASSPTPTPTVTPTPIAAPQPLVGGTTPPAPNPAPAAPQPAPAAPKPAPPAPAPAAPIGVNPGGFCSPSQVGQSGIGTNGRTYICGGKGADASGHFHWNVP